MHGLAHVNTIPSMHAVTIQSRRKAIDVKRSLAIRLHVSASMSGTSVMRGHAGVPSSLSASSAAATAAALIDIGGLRPPGPPPPPPSEFVERFLLMSFTRPCSESETLAKRVARPEDSEELVSSGECCCDVTDGAYDRDFIVPLPLAMTDVGETSVVIVARTVLVRLLFITFRVRTSSVRSHRQRVASSPTEPNR